MRFVNETDQILAFISCNFIATVLHTYYNVYTIGLKQYLKLYFARSSFVKQYFFVFLNQLMIYLSN